VGSITDMVPMGLVAYSPNLVEGQIWEVNLTQRCCRLRKGRGFESDTHEVPGRIPPLRSTTHRGIRVEYRDAPLAHALGLVHRQVRGVNQLLGYLWGT
jgi:hypothetical protein